MDLQASGDKIEEHSPAIYYEEPHDSQAEKVEKTKKTYGRTPDGVSECSDAPSPGDVVDEREYTLPIDEWDRNNFYGTSVMPRVGIL